MYNADIVVSENNTRLDMRGNGQRPTDTIRAAGLDVELIAVVVINKFIH